MTYAGGIAAAIALLVAVPAWRTPEATRRYEAAGATGRVIALANGIEVTLSPSSRIVVHGEDAHRIELAGGEVYFDVRHDPSRTLIVSAGGYSITDIGTRFSVNLSGEALRVGVSEGALSVSSAQARNDVRVTAGHQLLSARDGLSLSPVSIAEVGSWRLGRLSYNDAPLSLVAADISRYSGRPVAVDPSLEKAHFSGSLVIGDGSRLLSDLATVMGAHIRPEKNGDHLDAAVR